MINECIEHALHDVELVSSHELGRCYSPLHEHGPGIQHPIFDIVEVLTLILGLKYAQLLLLPSVRNHLIKCRLDASLDERLKAVSQ